MKQKGGCVKILDFRFIRENSGRRIGRGVFVVRPVDYVRIIKEASRYGGAGPRLRFLK